MAGSNTFGGTIKLEGEREYRQAISQINSDLKVMASEMGKVTAEFSKNDKSAASLTSQNKVLSEQIDKQKEKITTLKGALDQSSEKYGENDKKTNAWKITLNRAEAELIKMEKELASNEKSLNNTQNATDKNAASLKNFSNSADGAGKSTLKLGDLIKANLISEAVIGGLKALGSAVFDIAKKFGQFVSSGIKNASDLAESQNVVDVTFKENSETINNWAKKAANAYGMSELSAKKYNGTMGAMLKSMGLTDGQVLTMSTNMVGLAGDFASFYNLEHDEAFDKIRAGISGETEPLKQLGINMSVANLEAFALSQGIDKSYNSMTQAEQATLRYSYLMSVSADAQGDFARTSGSYANQLRIAKLNMENLATGIGSKLLPIFNEALNVFNGMFSGTLGVSEGFSKLTDMIVNLAEDLLASLPKVVEVGKGILKKLLDGITAMLPQVAPIAVQILETLISSVVSAFPAIVSAATGIILTLATSLINSLPELTNAAIEIIVALVNGISGALPALIPAIVEAVILIAQTLINNIDIVLKAAIELLLALVKAIPEVIKILEPKIPEIITSIVNSLVENIPILLAGAIELFMALVQAIPQIIIVLAQNLPQIVWAIIAGLARLPELLWNILNECISKFINWGNQSETAGGKASQGFLDTVINITKELPSKIWNVISGAVQKVVEWGSNLLTAGVNAARSLVSGVFNTICELPNKMLNIGGDLVKGLWKGISNVTGWILEKIRGFGSSILNGIKSFFGIKSPSKLFQDEVGKNLALGLGEGFTASMKDVEKQMQKAVPTSFKTDLNTSINAANSALDIANNQQNSGSLAANLVDQFMETNENISEKLDSILYFLQDYIPQLQKRQLCLDTGVLVGELTPPINKELAKIENSKERGR